MNQVRIRRAQALAAFFCGLAVAACGSKDSSDSSVSAADSAAASAAAAGASAQKAAAGVPDACKLLTVDEVKQATGWANPVASDITADRSYQSACNFLDGGNLARYVSVVVIVGGMTHADSAAYAQSVGNISGTLSEPAKPVDEFNVPAIETRMGGMHSMRGSTPQAVELTISSDSPEITRALFTAAVTRI